AYSFQSAAGKFVPSRRFFLCPCALGPRRFFPLRTSLFLSKPLLLSHHVRGPLIRFLPVGVDNVYTLSSHYFLPFVVGMRRAGRTSLIIASTMASSVELGVSR